MYARRHLSRRRQCWTTTTRTTEPGWLRPETAIGKYFSRKRLISFASRCGFVSARMQTCAAPINILTHNSLMRAFSFTAQLHVVQISINFFSLFLRHSAMLSFDGMPQKKKPNWHYGWARGHVKDQFASSSSSLSIHLLSLCLKSLIRSHRAFIIAKCKETQSAVCMSVASAMNGLGNISGAHSLTYRTQHECIHFNDNHI